MTAVQKWRDMAMKALINNIKITDRIRKELTKIDELAADIEAHGLINPITVMSIGAVDEDKGKNSAGEFRLLAGLRRLRAVESLGLTEIAITIVAPADAEAALRIEFSENEQREPFTFSEKMDFARLIEDIEREKALERKSIGGKGGFEEDKDRGPYLERKQSRDAIGEKIGMSGRQYDRAKHIAENATDDVIEELDRGKRSIRGTYDELKAKGKAGKNNNAVADSTPADAEPENSETDPDTIPDDTLEANSDTDRKAQTPTGNQKSSAKTSTKPSTPVVLLSKAEEEAVERNKAFNAMSPDEKVTELHRQLKDERFRACTAESELTRLQQYHDNLIYHKDGIIKNLESRLANAEARVEELEALYCSDAAAV